MDFSSIKAGRSCSAAARSMSRSFSHPRVTGKPGFYIQQSRSKFALFGVLDDVKKIIAGGDPTEALQAENDATLKEYMKIVEEINKLEDAHEALSDQELQQKVGKPFSFIGTSSNVLAHL